MSELLDSGQVGNLKTDEDIIKVWSDTGILEGLGGDFKLFVACAMERCAKILIKPKNKKYKYDTIIFPVIRRVMCVINDRPEKFLLEDTDFNRVAILLSQFDVSYLIRRVNQCYEPALEMALALKSDYPRQIDEEAEACALLSLILANEIMNRFRSVDIYQKEDGEYVIFEKPVV